MPTVIPIESLDDPRVEVYRDIRDADLRGRDRLFMAESELVVRRLLRTPERLHSLFLSPNKLERLREAIEEATGAEFSIYVADVSLISEVAGFLIHRGALAAGFRRPPEALTIERALDHLKNRSRLTLLLAEGITNVDNMGGLFRNGAAFGVDGIVLDPTCCDPLYRKAIRVSVGHTLAIPYAASDEWMRDLRLLKEEWGVALIGAESAPGSKPLWEMPSDDRLAIVFGSEAHGLHEATRAMCDRIIEVPMAPGVPSLNVSTAAAVFLYERIRMRGTS